MENQKTLQELEGKLLNFVPSRKHDVFALETIKEAINAAKSGTFGVGAVLVDNETNKIIYRGRNKVFSESRSDLHAEMDLLNNFEMQHKNKSRDMLKKFALYTSLESCPMCLCRIITAGVTEVYHLADDLGGGMVHLHNQLPPVWQEISKGRIFKKAECSDDLSEIAEQVFLLTVNLDNKLKG
ncbi:MAG: nucleoside deaminase [Treponema sp.]|jgi:cytosine deaminase|nr:nucleoside deaminase [Treponema sp.]